MANENGTWIMRGLPWDDPYRIRTWQELVNWVNEIGFLPLFANDITGFSAELLLYNAASPSMDLHISVRLQTM